MALLVPGQPVDRDGPVFREPWEASAFAIAVKLSEAGLFTWVEWADFLSQEIRLADMLDENHKRRSHDDGHHHDGRSDYYHSWFAALEKILAAKGIIAEDAVDSRHQYLKDNPVPHDHVAQYKPVCIV